MRIQWKQKPKQNNFTNNNFVPPQPRKPHFTSNILNWPNLRKAATAKDRDWVCSELHRDETVRPDLIDRNKWSYDKCMQGRFIK